MSVHVQPLEIEQASETPTCFNRREFLTYAWGAALALTAAEGAFATFFFLHPRFRAGEFGGKFVLGRATALPAIDAPPQPMAEGKFWLVNSADGPRAIYMVCTHLGCLYKWDQENYRFECPCHGSRFDRQGNLIRGPAARSLDQFVVNLVAEDETVIGATHDTPQGITPPALDDLALRIVVDTGAKVKGHPKVTG